MLQALLKGKLNRDLKRSAFEIEDLLTSVVIGTCEYLPHERALFPFLRGAHGLGGISLAAELRNVDMVSYEFWPNWERLDDDKDEVEATAEGALREPAQNTGSGSPADGPGAARSQPEVLLVFSCPGRPDRWLLLEAKLWSGKSSHRTDDGPVNDQLAKYWLQLKRRAEDAGAVPLGVVYLTTHNAMPAYELQDSLEELAQKGAGVAPLYWVSWRNFPTEVGVGDAEPMLAQVMELLKDHWQLVPVEPMGAWPETLVLAAEMAGVILWSWPAPPTLNQVWNPIVEER
jgi:hypothetical protein